MYIETVVFISDEICSRVSIPNPLFRGPARAAKRSVRKRFEGMSIMIVKSSFFLLYHLLPQRPASSRRVPREVSPGHSWSNWPATIKWNVTISGLRRVRPDVLTLARRFVHGNKRSPGEQQALRGTGAILEYNLHRDLSYLENRVHVLATRAQKSEAFTPLQAQTNTLFQAWSLLRSLSNWFQKIVRCIRARCMVQEPRIRFQRPWSKQKWAFRGTESLGPESTRADIMITWTGGIMTNGGDNARRHWNVI